MMIMMMMKLFLKNKTQLFTSLEEIPNPIPLSFVIPTSYNSLDFNKETPDDAVETSP